MVVSAVLCKIVRRHLLSGKMEHWKLLLVSHDSVGVCCVDGDSRRWGEDHVLAVRGKCHLDFQQTCIYIDEKCHGLPNRKGAGTNDVQE